MGGGNVFTGRLLTEMKTGMRLEAGTPKFEFFLSFGKAARGVKASTAEKLWDALSLDINPSDDSGCAKMANHLETLIFQYYDWKGWVVKKNVKVGRLGRCGYAGELDVVVYDHDSDKVLHYEPSTDASKWEQRDVKYKRKFDLGKKHIPKEVFPWLKPGFTLEQIAVFFNAPDSRKDFQGGTAISIDALVKMIRDDIEKQGRAGKKAIPEQYDLLRMVQLVVCGYVRPL